jgi:glycine betaine/choline ABC-type transport system substrate-binding protein
MRILAVVLACSGWLFTASAHAQQVRLAAPSDCLVNLGCGAGLRSVYGLDVASAFVPLTVADAGVGALADEVAEIAVAFSSNPQVSRPDIVELLDDKRMIHADHVVPVVRQRLLNAYRRSDARVLRARLDAASAALTTLALRGLNQSVIDGRLPEAVGGEFAEANGLSFGTRGRHGPRIDIGYMNLAENEVLAHLYGEALRGAGFRVRVLSVRGLRPRAVSMLRSGRIDLYPDYDGSLLRYLVGTSPARLRAGLKRTLARIGAEPMRLSPAEDHNVFVMKSALAAQLGITELSDLGRYWQTAGS